MRLAAVFSDHMVLRRDRTIPVWGWAGAGDTVTVELAGRTALASYRIEREAFLAGLPQDAGNKGLAEGWAGPGFDDSGWKTMRLPDYRISAGHPTNGVFWFRLAVDVPAEPFRTDDGKVGPKT